MTTDTKVPAISATIEGEVLTLKFSHGQTLTVDAASLSTEMRRDALMHGLKQKTVDAAAMSRNPETGRAASIADKFAAVAEVVERLIAGEWNKTREGGSGGSLLLSALIRLYEGRKTREELAEFVAAKTPKEQAALRANPKVSAIIDAIRAERLGSDAIDSDDLLDELSD